MQRLKSIVSQSRWQVKAWSRPPLLLGRTAKTLVDSPPLITVPQGLFSQRETTQPPSTRGLATQPPPGIQRVSRHYPLTTILCSSPAGTDALRRPKAVGRPYLMNTAHQ